MMKRPEPGIPRRRWFLAFAAWLALGATTEGAEWHVGPGESIAQATLAPPNGRKVAAASTNRRVG